MSPVISFQYPPKLCLHSDCACHCLGWKRAGYSPSIHEACQALLQSPPGGGASRVGVLAIHKDMVHKANEDCIISIDELGVVLSILLALEVEERVKLLHSWQILLLVFDVLVLLLTSAHDIPLGGELCGS